MKRLISLVAVLIFTAAAPLFALDNADRTDRTDRGHRTVIIVNDVIRMSQAGVSDEAIISYVRNTRELFDVSADDVIAMTDAHVSEKVVKAVVDEAAARNDNYDRRERRETTRETVYVAPYSYPYYYDPFFYPYYDPFFYGPRVFLGFSFGPRFVGHRGFRHHR